MAFRDDRDAQLRRAEALERENARLREKLAERERAEGARAAAEEARARAVEDARRSAAELDRKNAALREQLARARGPGLARRIVARLAALRLAEPRTDGDFLAGAVVCWRLLVPVLIGLTLPAVVAGGHRAWALLALAIGVPVVAGLALAVPWWLRRRRRVTAGLVTGAVIGMGTSLAVAVPLFSERSFVPAASIGGLAITFGLWLVTRAVRWSDVKEVGVPIFGLAGGLMLFPHPIHILIWFGFAVLGARLSDPSY